MSKMIGSKVLYWDDGLKVDVVKEIKEYKTVVFENSETEIVFGGMSESNCLTLSEVKEKFEEVEK